MSRRRRAAARQFTWEVRVPTRLHAPGVLQFDEQLVGFESPAVLQRLHVVIVDDEEIAGGSEGPPEPRVHADRLALGVVLQVARKRQVRREVQAQAIPDERLREAAARQPPHVALARELYCDE